MYSSRAWWCMRVTCVSFFRGNHADCAQSLLFPLLLLLGICIRRGKSHHASYSFLMPRTFAPLAMASQCPCPCLAAGSIFAGCARQRVGPSGAAYLSTAAVDETALQSVELSEDSGISRRLRRRSESSGRCVANDVG